MSKKVLGHLLDRSRNCLGFVPDDFCIIYGHFQETGFVPNILEDFLLIGHSFSSLLFASLLDKEEGLEEEEKLR